MTIFPYIKAIRKGILYRQGINKRSLFTDFHVPTNRVPPTIENAILFFPQSVGSVFFCLLTDGRFTSTTQLKKNIQTNKHKQTKQLKF